VRRNLQRERKSRDAAAEDEKVELFHTKNLADKSFNAEKNQEPTSPADDFMAIIKTSHYAEPDINQTPV
jgi:hypothetical protein